MISTGFKVKYFPFAAAFAAVVATATAQAQLMLPGAIQAAPPAGPPGPKTGGPGVAPARLKPVGEKAPDATAILGRDLARDGSAGAIAFQRNADKGLEITRLSVAGEAISSPGAQCRIDVVADAPIEAKSAGQPNGLVRYEVEIEACPFSFEVLDGAVLVARAPRSCDFSVADCRVDPTGLWGPPGASIDAEEIKQFERARGHAEASMRANFRALLALAGKDKAAVKKIAGAQAGFSSEREMTCRAYAREEAHGFCGLRITQARVIALQTEFAAMAKDRDSAKPTNAAIKKKPKL
jgi:hypothetical protein